MEIMKSLTSSLAKLAGCVFLTASSSFASDIVLQKVPEVAQDPTNAKSPLGPQASFALINYNVRDVHAKARTLYVSSGSDLKLANNMIDDQAATSFGFSTEDNSPVAIVDLGKVSTMRRLSAIYSARAGAIDFYVLQSLSGIGASEASNSLKVDAATFAKLKPVGSAIDDGTQGRVSVDFAPTAGRYVMLRWNPAAHADTSFTVAEISAFSPTRGNLLASNRNFSSTQSTGDSKDVADSKDVGDSKDLPEVAEGPPEVAAGPPGPPPTLPGPPPFTFIPQINPLSE